MGKQCETMPFRRPVLLAVEIWVLKFSRTEVRSEISTRYTGFRQDSLGLSRAPVWDSRRASPGSLPCGPRVAVGN